MISIFDAERRLLELGERPWSATRRPHGGRCRSSASLVTIRRSPALRLRTALRHPEEHAGPLRRGGAPRFGIHSKPGDDVVSSSAGSAGAVGGAYVANSHWHFDTAAATSSSGRDDPRAGPEMKAARFARGPAQGRYPRAQRAGLRAPPALSGGGRRVRRLGDGTVVLIPPTPHARPQSLLVRPSRDSRIVFTADACYTRENMDATSADGVVDETEMSHSLRRLRGAARQKKQGARTVYGHDPEQWSHAAPRAASSCEARRHRSHGRVPAPPPLRSLGACPRRLARPDLAVLEDQLRPDARRRSTSWPAPLASIRRPPRLIVEVAVGVHPRISIVDWRTRGGLAQVGSISTRSRNRRSGPKLVPEPWTRELSNMAISPGWSEKSTAFDSSKRSVMNWPRARMLLGSSLSSWRRMPQRVGAGDAAQAALGGAAVGQGQRAEHDRRGGTVG